MTDKIINSFSGDYDFLSNFYIQDYYFFYENQRWESAEAAFQAMKYSGQNKQIHKIFSKLSPSEAKALGKVINIRSDWKDVKLSIMRDILKEKFSIPYLKEKLIETNGYDLIEGNTWHDNFWGNCTCDKCKDIEGKNYLGKLLKQIRKNVSLSTAISSNDSPEPEEDENDKEIRNALKNFYRSLTNNSYNSIFSQCNHISYNIDKINNMTDNLNKKLFEW